MMKQALIAAGLGLCMFCTPAARAAELVTQPFRDEHVVIREHLGHMEAMVDQVEQAAPDKQVAAMQRLIGALETHIVGHAQWEEQHLYPVVDRLAGGGEYPFTAAMVHEHRIVGRWIAELEQISQQAEPDGHAFVRRATMLLGLIQAHFEDEEEVLLPVIDARMSREDFEAEVLSKVEEHGH